MLVIVTVQYLYPVSEDDEAENVFKKFRFSTVEKELLYSHQHFRSGSQSDSAFSALLDSELDPT
jgi:hypothetical protein